MRGLVQLVPKTSRNFAQPLPRLWLIFFTDGEGCQWWARLLRPGFRHVVAACWYDSEKRWVYFNPTWRGTVIELYGEAEFEPRLSELLASSGAVLRMPSRYGRGATPAFWHCLGAIKGLLGIRSRALLPYKFFLDLRRQGAEIVEVPKSVRPISKSREASGRGSRPQAHARGGAEAGRAGPDSLDAAAVAAGDLAG